MMLRTTLGLALRSSICLRSQLMLPSVPFSSRWLPVAERTSSKIWRQGLAGTDKGLSDIADIVTAFWYTSTTPTGSVSGCSSVSAVQWHMQQSVKRQILHAEVVYNGIGTARQGGAVVTEVSEG